MTLEQSQQLNRHYFSIIYHDIVALDRWRSLPPGSPEKAQALERCKKIEHIMRKLQKQYEPMVQSGKLQLEDILPDSLSLQFDNEKKQYEENGTKVSTV